VIPIASGVRVWTATGHTDMRRGMNSLALLVQEAFTRDPHGGDLLLQVQGRRARQRHRGDVREPQDRHSD
jgi:transposase